MTTPSEKKRSYSVLLCDDVATIRKSVKRFLEKNAEFQVLDEAAGGQESIAKAVQLKPDLVLMDVGMPEVNGIEATRQILLLAPKIKVLAYSGDLEWATVDRMLAAGAAGYVVKGSDPDEICRAARTILAGGHYLSATLLKHTVATPEDE